MLQVKNIVKKYGSGENIVNALNGVDITFRENEFVAILGHSGCGKTTLLNIIGGLDHYTSGDLIINGTSTKKYKDRDWDAYRNHSIGFIFQSYNLIPHQTVLSNVELALTISGVSKSERKKRAIEALKKVGLESQIYKKPNQMSGGQMQRVAIARALINNPDILLADEPTGALDSETSVQVMELLKEIAKDKLVIMVTHNPELAEQYSNRIVKIKDGKLISDTNPYVPEKTEKPADIKKKRVSMSFATAISLSLNNLMTKKGRTLLTSFAGSIGIIGIALILALSTGINSYITGIQEETLSSYPLNIMRETTDTASMLNTMMESEKETAEKTKDLDAIYANTHMYDMFNSLNSSAKQVNNMAAFKQYVESDDVINEKSSAIAYSYDIQMPVFTKDITGKIMKSDFNEIYAKALGLDDTAQGPSSSAGVGSMMSMNIWEEILPAENGDPVNEMLYDQYDLVYGNWPKNYDEIVVVLSSRNEIPDMVMYALGLKAEENFGEILRSAMSGEVIEDYGQTKWDYDELMNHDYKLILPSEYYQANENGSGYIDLSKSDTGLEFLYNSKEIGTNLKITGFIRPNEDSSVSMMNGFLGYTNDLTKYIINKTNESDVVKEQLADEENDVLSGMKFKTDDYTGPTSEEITATAKEYIENCNLSQKADVCKFVLSQPTESEIKAYTDQYLAECTREQLEEQISSAYAGNMGVDSESIMTYIGQMDDETLFSFAAEAIAEQYSQQYAETALQQLSTLTSDELAAQLDAMTFTSEQYEIIFNEYTPEQISESTYEANLSELGHANFDDPSAIRIYAKTFADKDDISDSISAYNKSVVESDQIHYTDYVALLMSSITDIISGISYLLIAFVGISLVVSSIMIGIITYISVLERTREIGILRAIGASKHDVSTVFNAETLLVGLTSGIIGIGVSLLTLIPINFIVHTLTHIDGLKATLPLAGAIILIVISMALTLIAGVIPSRVASKKDPVEALRTE